MIYPPVNLVEERATVGVSLTGRVTAQRDEKFPTEVANACTPVAAETARTHSEGTRFS
jgi:hypothetical protein